MKILKPLIAILALMHFTFVFANINFSDKSSEQRLADTRSLINPVGEAESGSIIYHFQDGTYLPQIALDTQVQMDITGVINRVRVEQVFTNPSNKWVEAVYVFPLPTDSAVDHLTMHIGNRIVEGQIKPRIEAKKIYEQAKHDGKKTALIEQQRPNIFTTALANIAPGESIKIIIQYQQAVLIKDDKFSIRFPMVVGERYVPGRRIATPNNSLGMASNTHQVPDASRITPPSSSLVNRPIHIDINLKAGFEIADVSASYHQIKVNQIDKSTQHIALEKDAQADRDFELVWQAKKSLSPNLAVFTQQQGNEHYLMLMATSPTDATFKKSNSPREMIFIIDSSGSMQGSSMSQAASALTQAINRLNPTDRFNIIDFDSTFTPLFEAALPAIAINKNQGINFANNLHADGGTEPLEAIKYAFASRGADSEQRLRQVIFLTDGQVSNEAEIFNVVRRQIGNDRLFTVGIGSAPNAYLMTKLAEFGRGVFTFIGDTDEVKQKMLSLFHKLESPALTNINIDFSANVQAQQALGAISDLYKGEVISAVFKLNHLPKTLSISGRGNQGIFTKKVDINASNNTKGIAKLWARRKIEQLTNAYQEKHRQAERNQIEQQITRLALEHHLVSKFTSLVAVDIQQSKPEGAELLAEAVVKKVKAANGATQANLWMTIGLLFMFTPMFTAWIRRHRQVA